jgi:hypothetical protein
MPTTSGIGVSVGVIVGGGGVFVGRSGVFVGDAGMSVGAGSDALQPTSTNKIMENIAIIIFFT